MLRLTASFWEENAVIDYIVIFNASMYCQKTFSFKWYSNFVHQIKSQLMSTPVSHRCWFNACSSGVCSTGLGTGPLKRSIRWVKSSPARWTWRSPTTKCRTTCPPCTTSSRSCRATARLSSTAVCSCTRRCTRSALFTNRLFSYTVLLLLYNHSAYHGNTGMKVIVRMSIVPIIEQITFRKYHLSCVDCSISPLGADKWLLKLYLSLNHSLKRFVQTLIHPVMKRVKY